MPVVLPEPDGIVVDPRGGETPVWQCPHCHQNKLLDDFGWRKRDDINPGQMFGTSNRGAVIVEPIHSNHLDIE